MNATQAGRRIRTLTMANEGIRHVRQHISLHAYCCPSHIQLVWWCLERHSCESGIGAAQLPRLCVMLSWVPGELGKVCDSLTRSNHQLHVHYHPSPRPQHCLSRSPTFGGHKIAERTPSIGRKTAAATMYSFQPSGDAANLRDESRTELHRLVG